MTVRKSRYRSVAKPTERTLVDVRIMLPVGRLFKLALWMQAAALASPIALMAYWSIKPLIIH
jgi:hypothetical protein